MDIKCTVCGEPWDAYGITHGDMAPWEARLFKQGAGCPSCEGVEPDPPFEPMTFADIENGDEDPIERLHAYENRAQRPRWERPPLVTLYSCECCGTKVSEDPGAETDDDVIVVHGRESYALERDYASEEIRSGVDLQGHRVCPACVETCSECGKQLCGALSDDPYDGLFSAPRPGDPYGRDVVCIDCLADAESEYAEESWANLPMRERIRLCAESRISIFAARRDSIPQEDNGRIFDYCRGD